MEQILPKSFSGASCLIYGVGKTGISLTRYLRGEGARVLISDKRKSQKEIEDTLEKEGIKEYGFFEYGSPPPADFVFRSPGMRPDSPEITAAVERGAVLTGETELFLSAAKGKIIGVTGSDGKTTTSAITAEILKRAFKDNGKRVFLGGNIGVPFTSFLKDIGEDDITVAEMSSFQLMTLEVSPYRAAITNITENHLDWHADMKEYIDSKCRIFVNEGCQRLVINRKTASKIHLPERIAPPEVMYTSPGRSRTGVYVKDGFIIVKGEKVMRVDDILLPGLHNRENYLTAIGLTEGIADAEAVRETAFNFKGVAHRMQLVCEKKGVRFYDSSIDSTPSRSAVTVGCFGHPMTVICGGYDKNLEYDIFVKALLKYADNVVITGENADKILAAFEKHGRGTLAIYREKDFYDAVRRASALGYINAAQSGQATVLLSPASASFDMFENYEKRGEKFVEIVMA